MAVVRKLALSRVRSVRRTAQTCLFVMFVHMEMPEQRHESDDCRNGKPGSGDTCVHPHELVQLTSCEQGSAE